MDEFEQQRQLIAPMLQQAIAWRNRHPFDLAATQIRVETYLDGVRRPFLGFVDFSFMTPLDMDTKTTTDNRINTAPRRDDVFQVSIYGAARQRPQSILYVTDKKTVFHLLLDDDLEAARAEMAAAARSLERFLSIMPDRETAIRSLPLNDHFSVSNAAKQKLAEIGV